MSAAKSSQTECARLLIDAGADKDAKDRVHVGRLSLRDALFP
jgi:hypothetical protein